MGGFSDPFEQSMPLLEYVLRGIKSDQVKKGMTAVRTRLPITPSIMQQLRLVWERDPGNCYVVGSMLHLFFRIPSFR